MKNKTIILFIDDDKSTGHLRAKLLIFILIYFFNFIFYIMCSIDRMYFEKASSFSLTPSLPSAYQALGRKLHQWYGVWTGWERVDGSHSHSDGHTAYCRADTSF